MKRNLLLSVILILAFMSALGGSIFNATYAFVGAAHAIDMDDNAIDNAEDISLEDVVPVDPFLGSINFCKLELAFMVEFENIQCGLFALIQNLLPAPLSLNFSLDEIQNRGSEKWLGKGLFLELGNLRL